MSKPDREARPGAAGNRTEPQRGKLRVFFGAAPGVGKTYAMLDSAHQRSADGVDVVVGYIDPLIGPETEAMLKGLEVIPARVVDFAGTHHREFDLDAALARHPALIVVDGLAHDNPPPSRHAKRWQDVEELLHAGISVYTTVNVQQLESLRDVASQITSVNVRETIPDFILENADEVELIDLSPDDLLQRLREGKIYSPYQSAYADGNFFRKGNLLALRELALRQTAERVDRQMQVYRSDHAVAQTWPAGERILVCISPNPLCVRLVRSAKRMAVSLHADWLTVYVETPGQLRLPEADRERVIQTLRLAKQLGAETVTLSGASVTEEVISYARRRNVTKIVVGKPLHSRWRDILFGSVLNDLVRSSGEIDVYAIGYAIGSDTESPRSVFIPGLRRTSSWSAYAQAVAVVAVCTVLSWLMFPYFGPSNLIMVYLVGVVVTAARSGRGPSIVASLLSVAAFDFFFVVPYLTFAVADSQYVLTFAVMLLVAVMISTLTTRIKQQAEAARERERQTTSLYALSRELANTRGEMNLVNTATKHISTLFESQAVILLPQPDGKLAPIAANYPEFEEREKNVACWVYAHGQIAGAGTETLADVKGLYLPLISSQGTVGVLGVFADHPLQLLPPDQLYLLETFASQAALAIERARLAEEAEHAHVQIETERLRNSLLSSVSHDLRTPLATITGAVSSLLENEKTLDDETRHELAQVAYEESERLNRLVGNLLTMTRLESGGIHVEKEWQPLEEIVGATLNRLAERLGTRPVTVNFPADLPPVPLDSVLFEQVMINLLENAIKYTPPQSPIELSATADADKVTVEIADHGPGLPPGDEARIFDKFYRAQPATTSGVGLGLTICRGIIEAHGGRIWAANRPSGGAIFRFTLPLDGALPEVSTESDGQPGDEQP